MPDLKARDTTADRPRRSQAERRQETQASILEACYDVLVEKGVAGLTTVEVAARAGVSRGAQAHYFRTREDLIVAATRYLMDRGTRHATEAAERARGTDDPVETFIRDAEAFFFDRTYLAMMELLVAARTDAAVRRAFLPIVRSWRSQINNIWLEVFEEAGIDQKTAWQILQYTNNILRGLALTSLWDDSHGLRDAVTGNWRETVKRLAARR